MGDLFGGRPKIEAPTPMPTPDDPQVDEARRRRAALARQQSGIQSTILSGGGSTTRETLGG